MLRIVRFAFGRLVATSWAVVVLLGCFLGCSSGTSSGTALPEGGADPDGGALAEGGALTDGGAPASAPLAWTFDGTATTFGNVSLLAPKGWTSKSTATELALTAPTSQGTCVIDVLAPRPAASGEAAQRAQLLDVLETAFAGHALSDPSGNATPTEGIMRGTSTQGYTFVGYDLLVDQGKLETHAYLAVFGAVAIPFATLWAPSAGSCLTSSAGATLEAQLLHTLTLAGAPKTAAVPASVVGEFSLGSTSVVELYTIQADGTFIFTLRESFAGSAATTTQSKGAWTLAGNIMSFFPGGGPQGFDAYSEYVRVYQASNRNVKGGWVTYFCLLGADSSKTAPSEACFQE